MTDLISLPFENWVDDHNGKRVLTEGQFDIEPVKPSFDGFRATIRKLSCYLPYAAWSEASVASSLYSAYKEAGIDVSDYMDYPFSWYVGD